jgi:hypothetical protein
MPELTELLNIDVKKVLKLNKFKKIDLNPNHIKSLDQIESILNALDVYEKRTGQEAAVGEYVNIHLGGTYKINSKKNIELRNSGKVQWYNSCYPRSYFEKLKNKLSSKKYENSPNLLFNCEIND